ncbi:MAG: phosphoribosylformylglycinamidine cyclo-ligase [Spirochaetales bacterium]|nr:phosphoribosylformylglycinamidine cyclo-ligase [Spirochaetales bacterium]
MELNYKTSGVDIDLANETKKDMAKEIDNTNKNIINKVGAFASLYEFNFPEIKRPVLVLKTEEPGSKQLLALEHDRVETICQDMIHHLINDCIVMGAKPIAVQDAIICGKLDKDIVLRMVKSISMACRENGCALSGGETSEQPGVLKTGTYVLTSSIVGIVDKEDIIDGSRIQENDTVIGLESSGLHTNGYTLIRKIIAEYPGIQDEMINGKTFLDEVLTPHRCYYNALKDLFPKKIINGLAHITGGGIKENLNRILPPAFNAEIDLSKIRVLPVFQFIKNKARLSDDEMLRTFNMSIGLTAVANRQHAHTIITHLSKYNIPAYEIGVIIKGNKKVLCKGNIKWK